MKTLHFVRPNNLSLLHDELLQAMPELQPIPASNGELDPLGNPAKESVCRAEGLDENIWLTVPDAVDEVAITAVVQAHDHNKQQPEPRQKRLERIGELRALGRSNWANAEIRELVEVMAQEITR